MSKNRMKTLKFGDGKEIKIPDAKKSPLHAAQAGGWTEKQKAALREAQAIYLTFKETFISTPCAPADIPGRFLAFRDTLSRRIKNAKVRKLVTELVDYDLGVANIVFGQARPPEEQGG